MQEIDKNRISDINYDRICLNCRYWQVDVQLRGAANGVICTMNQKHTQPTDSCNLFLPNMTLDGMQDPNRYFDKRNKMDVWKLR